MTKITENNIANTLLPKLMSGSLEILSAYSPQADKGKNE